MSKMWFSYLRTFYKLRDQDDLGEMFKVLEGFQTTQTSMV